VHQERSAQRRDVRALVDLELDELADAHVAHAPEAQRHERVAHRDALRIEHLGTDTNENADAGRHRAARSRLI
jgi:hypothetical protein